MIANISKGDSITLEFTAKEDITNWKIRAELFDIKANSVKLATLNSSGSDTQIKVINATEGTFEVYIPSGSTTNFEDKAKLEIEVDTGNTVGGKPEILTIFKSDVSFEKEQITWKTP